MIEGIIQGLMPSALWSLLRSVFRKTRRSDSRDAQDRVVIEKLDSSQLSGPFSSVTANPTDAIVLVRDGQVVDVYREEKLRTLSTGGSLRAVIGMGPDVTALRVDLRPFRIELSFGENAPAINADPADFTAVDESGDLVSAAVLLDVAFDPDKARRALWWSGTEGSVTEAQVEERLGPAIMAAVQPAISANEIKALRATEALLGLDAEIRAKLEGMAGTYGLVIEDVSVIWGLTNNEKASQTLDEAEIKAEIEKVRAQSRGHRTSGGPFTEIHGNVTTTTSSGMGGVWIVLLAAVIFAGIAAVVFLVG
jgi:hypothetical protein